MKRVAVCSGKGGTGKTIISLNLVHRLPNSALLDLDFTAPDVPVYLKADMALGNEVIHPAKVGEKKYFSIGYFGSDPMTWAGEEIRRLVDELFKVVNWGELDYLIIDCPPGLTQENIALLDKIDTAIIVTTPSPSSYADGKKVVEL
ncbi:MAG: P-loop NTPase, partial [archaeon]|nr:P-loop NTPase [archaeon]